MTHREVWEEKSFQVFTDEDGVLRSGWYPTGEGNVTGNIQVDRVWGNLPMQPDDDRTDNGFSFGGGAGDNGWDPTYYSTSDTLRIAPYNNNSSVQDLFDIKPDTATDHVRADIGYSNFPGYIPNYAGDGDSDLETVMPKVVRLSRNLAQGALGAASLDWANQYVNPEITSVVSDGTKVRFYVDNIYDLKVGDQVWPDNEDYDYGNQQVTLTAVNADPAWIEITVPVAPDPAVDTTTYGTVWPGDNVYNVVLQASETEGAILNEGTEVTLVILGD